MLPSVEINPDTKKKESKPAPLNPVAGERARHTCSRQNDLTVKQYASRVNCPPIRRAGDPPATPYGKLPGTHGCKDGSKAPVDPHLRACREASHRRKGEPGKVTAYTNVLPWQDRTRPHDPYGEITAVYDNVRWRYITRDRRYVMLRDQRGPGATRTAWYFVARSCVEVPVGKNHWKPLSG